MELITITGNWIIALGKTILHSLWMGLLVYSILRLLLFSIPDRFSNLRYRITLISIVLLLGSVALLFLLIYSPGEPLPDTIPVLGTELAFSWHLAEPGIGSGGIKLHLFFIICSYLYFVGITVMLIRSTTSFYHLRLIKRSGNPVDAEWYAKFLHLKKRINIKRKVTLMESDWLNVPSLVGFFKPAIIVPAGMLTQLSNSQVESILMHELFHLRRFDFLVNVLQLLVESVFFYNPFVWSISNQIRIEREKCCDDSVLKVCGDPLSYAKALYHLAGQQHQPISSLAPGAGGTDQFQLLSRIKRIINKNNMKKNIRERLYSLLLLMGGIVILLTISGFSSGFSIVKHHESLSVPEETGSPANSTEKLLPPDALDTIPEISQEELAEIKREVKEEVKRAMAEVDWDEIKREIEIARAEAMESIDWEEIKVEMEMAKVQMDSLMKDVDLDFDFDFDFDFDMDDLKIELENAMKELEEIDLEEIR